ncbi:unnamed protein product [Scytosiphon promiscuus]
MSWFGPADTPCLVPASNSRKSVSSLCVVRGRNKKPRPPLYFENQGIKQVLARRRLVLYHRIVSDRPSYLREQHFYLLGRKFLATQAHFVGSVSCAIFSLGVSRRSLLVSWCFQKCWEDRASGSMNGRPPWLRRWV